MANRMNEDTPEMGYSPACFLFEWGLESGLPLEYDLRIEQDLQRYEDLPTISAWAISVEESHRSI